MSLAKVDSWRRLCSARIPFTAGVVLLLGEGVSVARERRVHTWSRIRCCVDAARMNAMFLNDRSRSNKNHVNRSRFRPANIRVQAFPARRVSNQRTLRFARTSACNSHVPTRRDQSCSTQSCRDLRPSAVMTY